MRTIIGSFIIILGAAAFTSAAYCESTKVEYLVDRFYKATDVQKKVFGKKYTDERLLFSGTVKNVKEEDTFDIANDVKRRYYKITTEPQQTPEGNSFAGVLIYKDIDKITNISRGQQITREGELLRVVDEGLYLSVWIYEETLTQEEKELFK